MRFATESRLDLEIVFARPLRSLFSVVRRLALKLFQFFSYLLQTVVKLGSFDSHTARAAGADEMGFRVFFELADQNRILTSAFWTHDVDGLVFEHASSFSDSILNSEY